MDVKLTNISENYSTSPKISNNKLNKKVYMENITFEQRASEYAKSFGDVPNNETFSIDSGINSFRKD